MAIPHAKSGQVVDIRPLGTAFAESRTTTLIKTEVLEVIRLMVPAGKEIPSHQAPGEITVQCLDGSVTFTAGGESKVLKAGELLYLASEVPHSLHGIDDASVLLTIMLRQRA